MVSLGLDEEGSRSYHPCHECFRADDHEVLVAEGEGRRPNNAPFPFHRTPKDQEAYFTRRSNVSVLISKPRDIITKSWKSKLILSNYAVAQS